jgi:hypothetical protein
MGHAVPSFCEVRGCTRIPLASAVMDAERIVPSPISPRPNTLAFTLRSSGGDLLKSGSRLGAP